MTKKLRIAVIGSGISGVTAAFHCDPYHDVTLFEKRNQIGGHTHTTIVEDPVCGPLPIDMGFIVYNPNNYPHFCRFINYLGLEGQPSDMSFGFYNAKDQFWYCSDFPLGLFSQKSLLFKPTIYRLLWDIYRFNSSVQSELISGRLDSLTLGEYLSRRTYSRTFEENYLIPMCSAIWSSNAKDIRDFPMKPLIHFWQNHQLLQFTKRDPWMVVKDGSHSYLKAFSSRFQGRLLTNAKGISVHNRSDGVQFRYLLNHKIHTETFDHVIIATHANQALDLLPDPSHEQKSALSAWKYSSNEVILHSDTSIMPPDPAAWASWTVHPRGESQKHFSMTYTMNRLQDLPSNTPYFVSLNADPRTIDPHKIHKKLVFQHPIYTQAAMQTQSTLKKLNEKGPIYFCGSYFGYGFHEDGARSGLAIAKQLGCEER